MMPLARSRTARALATLVGGAAVLPSGANAQTALASVPTLTAEQCMEVRVAITEAVRRIGTLGKADQLSQEFKTSLRDFIGPNRDCKGTRDIITPTVNDAAAYDTIRELLGSGPNPIALERYGLRVLERRAALDGPKGVN
jgi:hypothetical protein